MMEIDLHNHNSDTIKINISERSMFSIMEDTQKPAQFPITILLPKGVKIIISSEPYMEDRFYYVPISIVLPKDIAIVINAHIVDYLNTLRIIETSKDIIMGVTGAPFYFHVEKKKALEFFAPRDSKGVRKFSRSKFDFHEMMEEYQRLMS
jgi:hypothetical protein